MILDLGAISGISKKLLFLHGKQNKAITGGWEIYNATGITEEYDIEIGETLYARGHTADDLVYHYYAILGTVDPIDVTNIDKIHFRVIDSGSLASGFASWRCGVTSVDYVAQCNGNKYQASANSNTYVGSRHNPDGDVWTLDVSELTGNYYVYIFASGSGSGESPSYSTYVEIDKIMTE